MIKKIILGIGSFIVSLILVGLIPFESFIKNQTASDAVIVVCSILLALTIYRLLKPRIIK